MLVIQNGESYEVDSSLLEQLLRDQNTNRNIIFGTDNYSSRGYWSSDFITVTALQKKKKLIRPRVEKSKAEQAKRSKEKAEVFTPSWVCNKQNNLIDSAWFGREGVFNIEKDDNTWEINKNPIAFPDSAKSWQDYVKDSRLEITCGEAPYITSRYDTVSGKYIDVPDRIGFLDRKLRVVNENCGGLSEWLEWSKNAIKATYGYEYQGDNLLIARKNVLFTFLDNFQLKFSTLPEDKDIREVADIITWNIFQMDGLKFVVPESCNKKINYGMDLFGDDVIEGQICPGCKNDKPYEHDGTYVFIMDWEKNKKVKFLSLIRGW